MTHADLTQHARPGLTVVIPTRNRTDRLIACLQSLASQSSEPHHFEVVVVDDGSAVSAEDAIAELRLPYTVRHLAQEHAGAGAARNRGALEASGRILLFLDDDMTADPQLVAEHLGLHRAQEGVVGLGRIALRPSGRLDRFGREFLKVRARHYARLDAGLEPKFVDCYSGNLSVERATFLTLGGFATALPREEDVELGYRFRTAGQRLVYLPGALSTENRTVGFRKITRDAETEGLASVELLRRHHGALPFLTLGAFDSARMREILLRRLFLLFRLPVGALRIFDVLLARGSLAAPWYQFVLRYAYWRGVLRAVGPGDSWRRLTRGTLILMYHAVGSDGERASEYIVPRRQFARQLAWIKRRSYPVISLKEITARHQDNGLPPGGSLVVTFDDGYRDFLTAAYPLLAEQGLPATIFLVTDLMGRTNCWDEGTELAGRPLLSWDAVRRIGQVGGIAVGSHTRTHASLPSMSAHGARDEVAGSRREIEQELGQAAEIFAYPYGHTSATTRSVVKEAGFSAACGTRAGRNCAATDPFDLRRLHVDGRWGLARFVLALWLGFDLFARWRR